MNEIKINSRERTLLADTITPVSIYLKLRDRFANSFLLESSDYHGSENNFSYICCSPMAYIIAHEGELRRKFPEEEEEVFKFESIKTELESFVSRFQSDLPNSEYIRSGLFGYLTYDTQTNFSDLPGKKVTKELPLAQYHLFQFIIALDHFKNQCHIIQSWVHEPDDQLFDEVILLIQQRNIAAYPFQTTGERHSDQTDEEYKVMVQKGIEHCHIGDVFQVVLSRKFQRPFQGDDFQVYRTLRSVNPSPYLFYFDYGSFRIFGSSPEAQLVLNNRVAEIHPIAGTFKRTGDDQADAQLAVQLMDDPKENAEHIMLVDLARNDLSRNCDNVTVATYKEAQFYSHVIHLVSKVTGQIREGTSIMDIVAETFPAGTLSGAPKIRAMEIIDENEKSPRGFYGGAVGFMDFDGNFNHAIMIRSFLSKDNVLKFQAGAGIVARSNPANELQEVYNKIGALERAIEEAERL